MKIKTERFRSRKRISASNKSYKETFKRIFIAQVSKIKTCKIGKEGICTKSID